MTSSCKWPIQDKDTYANQKAILLLFSSILPQKPRGHVRNLTYRTGAIDVAEIMILTYLSETGIIIIRKLKIF